MSRGSKKAPLFRRVNTKAHGVHHFHGGHYRHVRNVKRPRHWGHAMRRGARRGLDYTPLFRFLASKVGEPFDDVHSEAVARLDRPEPIFWLVASHEHERESALVRIGESSYFSRLYVDSDGLLQVVDPTLRPDCITPTCACCTFTFNGVPVERVSE